MKLSAKQFIEGIKASPSLVVVVSLLAVSLVMAWGMNLRLMDLSYEHFVYEAEGFAQGSVFFVREVSPRATDVVFTPRGNYWHLPPLPAVVFTPLVKVFGLLPWETIFNFFLTPLAVYLAYRLARRFDFSAGDSLWLSVAYTFGSVYLGVVVRAASWQLSSAVAGVLVLGAVVEYYYQRRFFILGALAGLALASRATAGMAICVFVGLALLFEHKFNWRVWGKKILTFALPVLASAGLLLWLNYARTGSLTDFGYMVNHINANIWDLRERFGLFDWRNIPTNIYYYFLAPVVSVQEQGSFHLIFPFIVGGLQIGFFFISPIFLLLFRSHLKQASEKAAAWSAGFITLLLLTYFSVNVGEFGPRYLIDILPLAFVVLMVSFSERIISNRVRLLITCSVLFNWYLVTTMYFYTIPRLG